MENKNAQEITNYDLFERLVKLSDAIQRLTDIQSDQGKTLDQLASEVSEISVAVSNIAEHIPND